MTTDNKLRAFALGAVLAGAALITPSTAHAEEVSPTGKGMVGTGLLGGEVVVFAEALFGVQSGLAYIIGAGVGAAGGVVGGYFIEKASDDGRVPAYLLAAGIAGIIPAVVVTLDATRYRPSEGAREDKPADLPAADPGQPGASSVGGAPATAPAPAAAPAPAPSTPPATTPPAGGTTSGGTQLQAKAEIAPVRATGATGARVALAQRPAGAPGSAPSLVGVQNGQLSVGVPVPEVRPILGSTERQRFGVENRGSEVRFPVVNIAF